MDRSKPNPDPLAPRLLRTTEAARYLGLGTKAIRQLIMSRQLPYVQMKPGNSPFLLDRRDLDKFIEMHKTPAIVLEYLGAKVRQSSARGEQ